MNETGAGKARLCIVTQAHSKAQTGGAEYQIDCLLDVLVPSERYEIYYLARLIDPDYRPNGYRIVQIGRTNRSPRFGYITDALPLYRALREIRPDVIYQRVACGYTAISAYFARRQGARMIWHVAHEGDVTGGRGMHGRNPIRRLLEQGSVVYGIRHATHIVTQTDHQARLLKLHYNRDADAVIPNFQPAPRERIDKTGPLSIIWIASLKRWKQPEVFVRLARQLSDLRDAQFIIVGARSRSTASDREWDNALMREIDATPNLQYLGPHSQNEVNELVARAHLLVNTSAAEGFPNTFIQAWMREVPVITLHVDPDGILAREAIGICAGSEANLAQAVRALAKDAAKRAEYGRRASQYAARRHSLDNVRMLVQLMDTGRIEIEPRENVEGIQGDRDRDEFSIAGNNG